MQSRLVGRSGAKGLLATIAALALLAPAASGKGEGGDAGKDGTGQAAPKSEDKLAAKDGGAKPADTSGGGKPAGSSGGGKPAGTSGGGGTGGGGKGLPATTTAPAPTTTTATTPAPIAAAPTTAAPRSSTTSARSTKPRRKSERGTAAPKKAARRERRTRRQQVSPAAPRLRSIAGPQRRPAMSFTALRPLSDSPVQPPAAAASDRPAAKDERRGVAGRVDRLGHALAGIPDGVGRRLEAFRAYAGPVGTAAGAALASLLLTLMVSTAVGYRGTGLVTGTATLQAMRRRRWAAESHQPERPQSRPYGSQSW